MDLSLIGGRSLGPSHRPSSELVLHVRDGRIAQAPEPGSEEVDASGLTLLPGFIDSHVHIAFFDPADVVLGGVTTARDLAWPEDEIFTIARRSREATFRGPEVLATGPMLTVEGGYPTRAPWAPEGTGIIVDGTTAPDVVERLAQHGAVAIKVALNADVGPTLDVETLRTIVRAAHGKGLRVTAHINRLTELDRALDAGVDELAHMLMSSDRIPDEIIRRMVTQGTVIVPTLSCRSGYDLDLAVDNLRRFIHAGGSVIYGTDLGNEGPRPGIDPNEIAGMQRAGMSGIDIVRSATSDAAAWLGLSDRGMLSPGKRADIIGVRGAPEDDPTSLANVALVIRAGELLKAP